MPTRSNPAINATHDGTVDRAELHHTPRMGLAARLAVIALVLVIEALLLTLLLQGATVGAVADATMTVHDIHNLQHWLYRFLIAYAGFVAIAAYLAHRKTPAKFAIGGIDTPVRFFWCIGHVAALTLLVVLSASESVHQLRVPYLLIAVARSACAVAAAIALFAALAPLPTWWAVLRKMGSLPIYALVPAAVVVFVFRGSQLLWAPAAGLTFRLVQLILKPLRPDLHADLASLTLSTDRFAVMIAGDCSGLEGVSLMLVFCVAWLWYFRREYYFPRVLVIVPAALLVIYLMNAVRISALLLIGDSGYERIAKTGFHSQAGWIAFNLAAFAIAFVANRTPWFNRDAGESVSTVDRSDTEAIQGAYNPVAPFLMPLIVILGVGMFTRALSGGFDWLYPLRLVAGALALWVFRRRYGKLDWRFSWRGAAVGTFMFVFWGAAAHFFAAQQGMPEALAKMSASGRLAWITSRIGAAAITVPIAEELAYRGYLLRRLMKADFDAVSFHQVRWAALVLSAIAFGFTHGAFWLPGIAAGLAYGLLAIRTGRIGEAVIAHGLTNALLAAYVLLFDQWQLW
jgi:exosortase E/protease (VPEID-CTERM system)